MKNLIGLILLSAPVFAQGQIESISGGTGLGLSIDIVSFDTGDQLDVMVAGDPIASELRFYHRNPGGFDWQIAQAINKPGSGLGFDVELDRQLSGSVFHVIAGSPGGDTETYTYNDTLNFWFSSGSIANPGPGSNFGASVDIDYNGIVPLAFVGDSSINTVYVFDRTMSGWSLLQTIVSPNAAAFGEFGADISYDGEFLVIGAPSEASLDGRIYVYENLGGGAFSLYQTFNAPNPAGTPSFGRSVDLENDLFAVGAPSASGSGEAYAFELSFPGGIPSWSQTGTLTASDAAPNDDFGRSVDVDFAKDRIVVGAPAAEDAAFPINYDHGAAYVYQLDAGVWSESYRIRGPESIIPLNTQLDLFGRSVSIDGQYVVAGRPRDVTKNGEVDSFASENFIVSQTTIDGGSGGTQKVLAYPDPTDIGDIYFLFGSFSPLLLPDTYTTAVINSWNSVTFPNSIGIINGPFIEGTLNVPAGTSYTGFLYHSYVIVDLATFVGDPYLPAEDLSIQ
jgi:hypothetical protein